MTITDSYFAFAGFAIEEYNEEIVTIWSNIWCAQYRNGVHFNIVCVVWFHRLLEMGRRSCGQFDIEFARNWTVSLDIILVHVPDKFNHFFPSIDWPKPWKLWYRVAFYCRIHCNSSLASKLCGQRLKRNMVHCDARWQHNYFSVYSWSFSRVSWFWISTDEEWHWYASHPSNIVAVSELVPLLNIFLSLIGAMCSSALALIFPPVIELVCAWNSSKGPSPFMLLKNIAIMLIAVLGLVTGTYESLNALFTALQKGDYWNEKWLLNVI